MKAMGGRAGPVGDQQLARTWEGAGTALAMSGCETCPQGSESLMK